MKSPIRRSLCIVVALAAEGSIVNGFMHHKASSPTATHLHPLQILSAFQVSPFLWQRDGKNTELSQDTTVVQADLQPAAPRPHASTANVQSGLSMSLIRAIWFNQGAILLFATAFAAFVYYANGGTGGLSSVHWNAGTEYYSLFDWNITPVRLLEGIIATVPMVFLGCTVEYSDRRDASLVNFSTVNMVISLFGRRESTRDPEATRSSTVMLLGALIALSTGISEEVIFRGYIPTGIKLLSNSVAVAAFGQALLFALAHVSPKSPFGENRIVGGLQLFNGLWYGLVYAVSGGDIVPCIIAHTLYDMHVLCETWVMINQQMDYTQDAFQSKLDDPEIASFATIQQRAGPSLNEDTINFARRFFYAFDFEHKGSLCLSDVQRAVTYAFMKDDEVPKQEDVEGVFDRLIDGRDTLRDYPGSRLTVSEFVRLLLALKSKGALQL